ncbi:MFS transporter [Heliobacillus mobilis]|uniref:MFS transporter n=1 Tax=Heliobacterium mobile TaxID=28064 RepID=A0A6I3SN33_HELMO|nr:MFS transporter [Heliobacterium mobile]MTV49952.1 MFS transporter [Heliobacterium mobile]
MKEGRATIILFITLFLVMAGFGVILPTLPYLVIHMGGNSISLGFLTASYSLLQFFFAPLWGRWSDRIGRRPVLLIGLSGYGVTFILFGLASQLWMLFAIRLLSGMISSATLPTAMAYMADITPAEKRASGMGMMGAAMGLGMIVGPALGGWLGHYGFSIPFFVAGAMALMTMPFAFALLPESLKEENRRTEASTDSNPWPLLRAFRHPQRWLFGLTFIISFTMALFEGTFALFSYERFQFGTREMGFLFAALGFLAVLIQAGLMGKLVKRFGNVRLIMGGLILSACGLTLTLFAPAVLWLFLFTALYSMGSSILRPNVSTLVSQTAPEGQGISLGIMQSFDSLGRIMGPIVGGALYHLWFGLPYLAGALSVAVTLLVSWKRLQGYGRLLEEQS